MPRTVLALLFAGALGVGCENAQPQTPPPGSAEPGPAEARFEASCVVNIWSAGPSATFVHGYGQPSATPEEAVASAWAALCAELERPEPCGERPPADLRVSESCSAITANDQTQHSCVLTATVRTERQRATATVERTGAEAETEPAVVCAEARAQACAEVGAEPGCTEGSEPAWAFSEVPFREQLP